MSETEKKSDAAVDPAEKDGKYGKGFAIRMVILLGLLALVGAGWYYDTTVLAPQNEKTIDETFELAGKPSIVGKGITPKEVAETVGFAPSSVEEKDGYEIETYKFKRALPFAKSDYLTVIYQDDSLVNILHNRPYALEHVKPKVEWTGPGKEYTGNNPMVGGVPAGGADGGAFSDDEEEGDEEPNQTESSDSDKTDADTGESTQPDPAPASETKGQDEKSGGSESGGSSSF